MLPRLREIARRQAGIFTRRQALACGYAPEEIRTRLADGRWRRVRHGVYVEASGGDLVSAYLQRCRAATLVSGPGAVLVGPSACVVHGLAMVDLPEVVHVAGRGSRSAAGMRVLRDDLSGTTVLDVDGLSVVDPATGVVQAARLLPFGAAVVVADSALRSALATADQFAAALAAIRTRSRATRVVAFADPRSESVGESLARVALDAAGLPKPELQVPLTAPDGRRYRVDFFWPKHRTIGEFDGKVKYGADPRALWAEKRREDGLRSLGLAFARFGSADLHDLRRLSGIVRAGFSQGRRLAG